MESLVSEKNSPSFRKELKALHLHNTTLPLSQDCWNAVICKTISIQYMDQVSRTSIQVFPLTAYPEITGERCTHAGHAASAKELEMFVVL